MFPAETRILVVDDMQMMRTLIRSQLRGMGYSQILDAENGEKAFEILTRQHASGEPVQLVLSDWNMPVLSGLDLLKKVRAHDDLKELPFVLVTAKGETHQVKQAIEAKVSNYIRKPFTPATIQAKLQTVWKKLNPSAAA